MGSFISPSYRYSFGTNCTPYVADLLFNCFERDFKSSLHQADVIHYFYDISHYLNGVCNINHSFFETMVPTFCLKDSNSKIEIAIIMIFLCV